jgi:3'(2'), 5'-bisphosphate nucleotidase
MFAHRYRAVQRGPAGHTGDVTDGAPSDDTRPSDEPRPGPGDETDAELATRLAVETGRLLVTAREQLWDEGAHHWDVMDTGDALGHRYIAGELARLRPDDAVLDEEGCEDPRRFDSDRCWIIDPLDGTREFGEPGRHDWAVHVALWDRDRLTAGAVSLPAIDLVLSTDPAPVLPDPGRSAPRIVTSRFRAPYAAVIVANELGCDAIRLGSAGAKAMAVVLGEADIYLHDGGMYQWDSAAPAAVALAAGLHVSRIDGSPIVYNEPDPWLPDLLICRPELADDVLRALWGDARSPLDG